MFPLPIPRSDPGPYLSMAESAQAAGARLANALAAANQQQQKLKEQQRVEQATHDENLQKEGWQQVVPDAAKPVQTDAQGYAIPQEEDPEGVAAKQPGQHMRDPLGPGVG